MDAKSPLRFLGAVWCHTVMWSLTAVMFPGALLLSVFIGSQRAFGIGLRHWGWLLTRLALYKTSVEGFEKIVQPAVWAANHRNYADIMLLVGLAPGPVVFVARQGVIRAPIIGSVLKRGGHLLVRRGVGAANTQTLQQAVKLLSQGVSVIFFPEGTRSRDGSIGEFLPGAFHIAARAGVPLIPMALAGTEFAIPYLPLMQPARLAVRMLEPVTVIPEQVQDSAFRESIRARVEEAVQELQPLVGPRI